MVRTESPSLSVLRFTSARFFDSELFLQPLHCLALVGNRGPADLREQPDPTLCPMRPRR